MSHEDSVVEAIAALLAYEGMLLESARGPLPNVAELVAGGRSAAAGGRKLRAIRSMP